MKPYVLLIAAVLLAGCGSSPRPQFYTLHGGEFSGKPMTPAFTVAVGPVAVPDSVDRPQIVLRTGTNQVALAEQARWAEPLKSSIPRVIASNLSRELATARVVVHGNSMGDDADYRVVVDVERFESRPGDAVVIEAAWLVRPAKGGEARSGRAALRESTQGKDYDSLVAAHSRALTALSSEIAQAIRSSMK